MTNPLRRIDKYTYVHVDEIAKVETFPLTQSVRVTMRDGVQFSHYVTDEEKATLTTGEGCRKRGDDLRSALREIEKYDIPRMPKLLDPAGYEVWKVKHDAKITEIDATPDPEPISDGAAFEQLAIAFIQSLTR